MASVRIIPAVTDGKGGRRPRSNRRRTEKPVPVSARKDDTPKRQNQPKNKPQTKRRPQTRKQNLEAAPTTVAETPAPEPFVSSLPIIQPVPRITTGPLAAWEPEMAEAILLALAAYNELRKSDPNLTQVGTI